ncbi:MAG: hypothetical protein ACK5PS_02095 [Desulfopila sp.]
MIEQTSGYLRSDWQLSQLPATGRMAADRRPQPDGSTTSASAADRLTLSSGRETAATYDSQMNLHGSADGNLEMLKRLVIRVFTDQGIPLDLPVGNDGAELAPASLETMGGDDAAALVGENGYFGVEQTSDRIVHFAISIAGGDPAKIETIKAGVQQGFDEAKEAFGDWLPEISYTTLDRIMEKLDAWVNDAQTVQA